jgi:hypothetical protein
MARLTTHTRAFLAALLCTSVIGCTPVKQDVKEELPKLIKAPEEAPRRTITNFSSALRCMDNLMISYGVYDISMLVEDIRDSTENVKVGAKDMLISAISEMTRRSHAIRLIAYGNDSGNLVSFLLNANQTTPYAVIPQYDIRGSISQLDQSVAAKDVAGGLSISEVGIGGAKTANASVMALDLAVINTKDYSVIPGVVSKNTIVIFKEGKGLDSDASIGKFGVNFSMNLTRSEGDAQALRNLIELASVELVGKLTKTPYWACLGIDPEKIEIQNELHDWYYNLVADQQIVQYFQLHLGNRGYYKGAADGRYSPELTQAVKNYQRGLRMEPTGNIDRELFDALLNKPVPPMQRATIAAAAAAPAATTPTKAAPAKATPTKAAPAKATPTKAANLDIRLAGTSGETLNRGEQFAVTVRPDRDAHVFCYFAAEDGSIQRFFPNRFTPDSMVRRQAPLTLPGGLPFKLFASNQGNSERLACFSSPAPLMSQLPAAVKGTDFENLPVKSLEQVEATFKRVVGTELGGKYLEINVN